MIMREKLMNYNFSVIWTPGKSHHIVDALSRAPVFGPCDMDFEPEHLEIQELSASSVDFVRRRMRHLQIS